MRLDIRDCACPACATHYHAPGLADVPLTLLTVAELRAEYLAARKRRFAIVLGVASLIAGALVFAAIAHAAGPMWRG